jgi:hypothetical protein
MCVLLCANRYVYEWLDLDIALACRDALQLSPVCHVDSLTRAEITDTKYLDDAAVQKLVRGPMLRQPAPRKATKCSDGSAHERKNSLDTLAKAWSRLLILVGLR